MEEVAGSSPVESTILQVCPELGWTVAVFMPSQDSEEFVSQGRLSVEEAERILPRLRNDKIRFQIETSLPKPRSTRLGPIDRVELFVHTDDIAAWQKIRAEYFPI